MEQQKSKAVQHKKNQSLMDLKAQRDLDHSKHQQLQGNYDKQRSQQRALKGKIPIQATTEQLIQENFKKIEKKITPTDISFIKNCLQSHFVFNRLHDQELNTLVSKMFYCSIQKNDFIIHQGDDASSFFILEKGKIQILVNDEPKRELNPGTGFGELALLYNTQRSASCKSLDQCFLWGIDRLTFKRIVEDIVKKEQDENRKFIEKVKFFENLTSLQKDSIAGVIIEQQFQKDYPIVNENDQASSFYIIKSGSVSIQQKGIEQRVLRTGESFGEQALLSGGQIRACSVISKEVTKCLAIGRDTITKILGSQVELIIYRNVAKWTIEKSEILHSLSQLDVENILDHIQIINFKKEGDIVLKKGKALKDQLILVLQGKIQSGAQKFEKYERVFDQVLINQGNDVLNDDLVVKAQGTVVAMIENKKLQEILGASVKSTVEKYQKLKASKVLQDENIAKQVQTLNLNEFKILKLLGSGQFGSVYLVKSGSQNSLYAMKCIQKQMVLDQHLEKYVQDEKSVMEKCNFPFIMRYFKSFKDSHFIFFLLEFIAGMELFDVIREIGLLSTFDSQFYIGSMILAIEYMHQQNIVYRDIKPENIMVNNQGYPKIVDLGTAYHFKEGKARTFTIIGTPHYMAPEVLAGRGYTYDVDLWSIGICLYEFMCGYVPFGEEAEDPYQIYEEIIKNEITFPNYVHDEQAKKLMLQLLSKTPEMRLGGSFQKLKRHPWFSDFKWNQLLEQSMKAPWLPPVQKVLKKEDISLLEKKAIGLIETLKKEGNYDKKFEKPKDVNWDVVFG